MSGSRAAAAAGAGGRPQTGRGRLAASVDLAVLVGVDWDPLTQVFAPDPAHRLLGCRVCAVPGCGSEAWCRDGPGGAARSARAGGARTAAGSAGVPGRGSPGYADRPAGGGRPPARARRQRRRRRRHGRAATGGGPFPAFHHGPRQACLRGGAQRMRQGCLGPATVGLARAVVVRRRRSAAPQRADAGTGDQPAVAEADGQVMGGGQPSPRPHRPRCVPCSPRSACSRSI